MASSPAFDPYHYWLGIAPKDQPPHHYRLLAIDLFESNADVIALAADQRMAHLRTFQNGPTGPLSQKLLNEVAAARICLLNPERKIAYDSQLRARLSPRPPAAPVSPSPSLPAPAYAAPMHPTSFPAPVTSQSIPRPANVIDSYVVSESASSDFRSTRGNSSRNRASRGKQPGMTGPRMYTIGVLVIGVVGLAAILWVRANQWQIQLVGAEPKPATKQLARTKKGLSAKGARKKQTDQEDDGALSDRAKPTEPQRMPVERQPPKVEQDRQKLTDATKPPGTTKPVLDLEIPSVAPSPPESPKQTRPEASPPFSKSEPKKVPGSDDLVKVNLGEAKRAYAVEIENYNGAVAGYFENREEKARTTGNRRLLDQIQAERMTFEKDGSLPKLAPTALRKQFAAARTAAEEAYRVAVKEYKKVNREDDAASIQNELDQFTNKKPVQLLITQLVGSYRIINRAASKHLAVGRGGKNPGDRIIVWERIPGNPDQEWSFKFDANGGALVVNRNSGHCMGVSRNSSSPGADVIQWPLQDHEWRIERVDSEFVRFRFAPSGLCLEAVGDWVTQSIPSDSISQQWKLEQTK